MAVNWLKGLVAPVAFQQPQPQGQPMMGGVPGQDAPPVGGSPYGMQPPIGGVGMGGNPSMPGQAMGQPIPHTPDLQPMQWSTGTRTVGQAQSGQPSAPQAQGLASGSISGSSPQSLEARCAELEHDVASLALFARALLTLLEDKKVVSRDEFMEVKNRLDMLDGKIDDR